MIRTDKQIIKISSVTLYKWKLNFSYDIEIGLFIIL